MPCFDVGEITAGWRMFRVVETAPVELLELRVDILKHEIESFPVVYFQSASDDSGEF